MELPQYEFRKTLRAAKILRVGHHDFGHWIHFSDGPAPIKVSVEFHDKHQPEIGGYYITHEDGREVCSSAEAFEAVFTAVKEEPSESDCSSGGCCR